MTERRIVLKVLAGCGCAAAAVAAVGPATVFVAEPGRVGAVGESQWYRVARLESLETGHPTKASVIGAEVDAWTRAPDRRLGAVWLIRDSETAVRAFSVVCPHLGCGIELAQDRFFCPCHDSSFDLSGRATAGPSPRGMDPIDVRLADGWIQVRFVKYRQGVPERVAI